MWLCDRGRFGYAYVNAPERVRAARVSWRPPVLAAEGGQEPVEKRRDRALDAAAALVRGRRVIGIGSPQAPLEANHALRTLVGPAYFYDGMSDADHELVGVVLEVARSGLRLGALGDVQGADVVLVLGEDLTEHGAARRPHGAHVEPAAAHGAGDAHAHPQLERRRRRARQAARAEHAVAGDRRTPPSSTRSPPRPGGRRPTTSPAWPWRSPTSWTRRRPRCRT